MIRISKLTDYATIILSYLALDPIRMLSAASIAKACHLSVATVSKILKILSGAELVKSSRGTGGGYQLARGIQEITLADVVCAIEGEVAVTECCGTTRCALDSLCAVKENWHVINKMIINALAGVTLNDMIRPQLGQSMSLRGIPVRAVINNP